MAKDRDKRDLLTPPPGVAEQLAKPENFEQQHTGVTPVHGVPIVTGPVEGAVQTLVRRSAQTKNIVIDVQSELTQLGGRVETLELKVEGIGKAIDRQEKQNDQIIGMTSAVLRVVENQSTVTTTTQLAQVEVTKTRALTENELAREHGLAVIHDKKERWANRRDMARKVFEKSVLPILAAIATYLAIKLGA